MAMAKALALFVLMFLTAMEASLIILRSDECPINVSMTTPEKRFEYWESERGGEGAVFERSLKHMFADMEPEDFYKTLNGGRVKRFFEELDKGNRTMHVYVFGGSLTAGRFVGGVYGAWPTVLRDSFNNLMRKKAKEDMKEEGKVDPRIHVHNLATAATTSEWLLHRLPAYFPQHRSDRNHIHSVLGDNQAADLIILDYNANDCSMHSVGTGAAMDAGRRRVLGIEEALLRRLMQLQSAAVVLYDVAITHLIPYRMEPRCEDEYRSCYAMYEIFQPVLKRYAVPVVSQKEGLWEHFHMPPPLEYWDCTKSCAHPKHKAHGMLAGMQRNYFLRMIDAIRSSNITGKADDAEGELVKALGESSFITNEGKEIDNKVCSSFETSVDHVSSLKMLQDAEGRGGPDSGSGEAEAMLVHNSDPHCWTYGQDVPGKFGWLINATDENSRCLVASLVFRVKFGSHEQAIAMSLQTYDKHAGIIEVAISRPIEDVEAAVHRSYVYKDGDFAFQGALDNYYANRVGDDLRGHSTIEPLRVDNEPGETDAIKAGKVQYLRLRLVNPNLDTWRIYRPGVERGSDRLWPIRAKLASLVTC